MRIILPTVHAKEAEYPNYITTVRKLNMKKINKSINFCCNWVALLPITCHRLASWYQASTSLYNLFNPGLSRASKAVPSPMASSGLSQCQSSAFLHDSCMLSKEGRPGWLLFYQVQLQVGGITLTTASVCWAQGNTFHRISLRWWWFLFKTDNLLAPAD